MSFPLLNRKFILILFLSKFLIVSSKTNFLNCKMTHVGDDYAGMLAKSISGHNCEHWDIAAKELKIHLRDLSFPDGSKALAKNYCRNPTRQLSGPWCFIRDGKLTNNSCSVPFCTEDDCRATGVGEEYRGTIKQSVTGADCMSWESENYDGSAICPSNRTDECNFCRNPAKNRAGPWCFVLKNSMASEELCDIPFCDDGPVRLFSSNTGDVAAFHKLLNATWLSIRIRLWDASDWYDGHVSIILSALDVPIGIKDIGHWGSALSISIGNSGSAIMGSKIYDRIISPGILTADWLNISVTWSQDLNNSLEIYVYFNGEKNPSLMANINTTSTVLQNFNFSFFAIIGTLSFFQLDSESVDCLITSTSNNNYTMWQHLEKDADEVNIEMYYRIFYSGTVHLKEFPEMNDIIKITLFQNGSVIIEDLESEAEFEYVTELHSFWTWNNLNLSIIGTSLYLSNYDSENNIVVNETITVSMHKISWIGMSSETVAYWAINCNPNGGSLSHLFVKRGVILYNDFKERLNTMQIKTLAPDTRVWASNRRLKIVCTYVLVKDGKNCRMGVEKIKRQLDASDIPKPEPPECVTSKSDLEYNGSQSIAFTGKHCIPWIDSRVRQIYRDEYFKKFGGRLITNNYCRNLDSDADGPFCFVRTFDEKNKYVVIKQKCNVRNCSILDCKHSGIGSDYAGMLSITKSHRECSSDYCRNPDHSLGGPWCYTSDTNVQKDFCLVKDCDRTDTRMILVSHRDGNNFYILPHWRKEGLNFWLKNWIPELDASATIKLIETSQSFFKITINERGNDKVELRIVINNRDELLQEETMSHTIRSGGWTGLWLRCGLGYIELGREKMKTPFLYWKSEPNDKNWQLYPMLLSIETENNLWLGVSFTAKECLIEKVSSNKSLKYWPLHLNKNDENEHSQLEISAQGQGIISINFYTSPESDEYYSLIIEDGKKVKWCFQNETVNNIVVTESEQTLIRNNSWTELIFRFNETFFMFGNKKNTIFSHTQSDNTGVMLFYWLNVDSKFGEFSWAVGCQPLELSGEAKNGGWGQWSSWVCSASCGGGSGHRTRECNNPPPNIFGKECEGISVHEGNCNDQCGDVSPDVLNQIKKILSSNSVILQVEVGTNKELHCNKNITILLYRTIPNVKFVWTKNGFFYGDSKRNTSSLDLWNIGIKDSGVWMCSASWAFKGSNKTLVMHVIALIVTSETATSTVRESLDLTLHSNALSLSLVYTGLSLQWYFNGVIWHDYGIIAMELVPLEKIEKIDKSYAGVWTCVVTQEELGLTWLTEWQRVNVIDPPNFWSHLIEDNATAVIFGAMTEKTVQQIVILGIGFFFVFVLVCAFIVNKL